MTSIASAQHQVNPVQSGHHTSVEHWHGHVNDNRRQEFFDEWEAEAEPVVWGNTNARTRLVKDEWWFDEKALIAVHNHPG